MKYYLFLFTLIALLWSNKLFAYDIAVENADGVTIYYNYINDGKELEVTASSFKYLGYDGTFYNEYKTQEETRIIENSYLFYYYVFIV